MTLADIMETRDAVVRRTLPPVPRSANAQETLQAAAQQFVARMRAAAAGFAAAAGAESAVVPEVVPPARHRRARCRMVLRHPGGAEADVTLLGPAGAPTPAAREWFDGEIRRWLAAARPRQPAWLVSEPGVPGGVAVDLCAWQVEGHPGEASSPAPTTR